MIANDEKLLINKETGHVFTADELMEIVNVINKMLQFNDGIALGINSRNNEGDVTGYNLAGSAFAGGPEQVAIGDNAKGYSWRAVAVGGKAIAGSVSATAVGAGTVAEGTHGVAVGRGAYGRSSRGNTVYGGIGNLTLSIGTSWAHKHRLPPSTIGIGNYDVPSNESVIIHGVDAYDDRDPIYDVGTTYDVHDQVVESDGGDCYKSLIKNNLGNPLTDTSAWLFLKGGISARTGTTENNVAGGHLTLRSGRGTGTEKGGEVRFRTAPAANGGDNVQGSDVTAGLFDSESGVDTRFLLLDTTDGTLKRVTFGADDSAGTGYKVLRVEN